MTDQFEPRGGRKIAAGGMGEFFVGLPGSVNVVGLKLSLNKLDGGLLIRRDIVTAPMHLLEDHQCVRGAGFFGDVFLKNRYGFAELALVQSILRLNDSGVAGPTNFRFDLGTGWAQCATDEPWPSAAP